MRRVAMLSMLMVFFLMTITQPIAADAQLEIIISDTEVFQNEEFGFDVKLTNPDALAYSGFHLYSRGVEELEWGSHTFRGQDYTLYTYRFKIALGELGYYTLYVEAFSYFVEDITIVESISIHVVEKTHVSTLDFGLAFLTILAVAVGLFIVSMVRKHKATPSAPPRVESSKIDRPGYREPAPLVLIVCPYCGAKNEQGLLKCRKCSAEM